MSKEVKKISIEEIMLNKPIELTIPIADKKYKVLIRDPSKRDRMEARIEASKMKGWDTFDDLEKRTEITRRIALKMLVEPKITEEQYMEASDLTITAIIDAVSDYYLEKLANLNKERFKQMKDFLSQMMVKKA